VLGRHSRESGNPEAIDFEQTGFPIKHSGMTDEKFFQRPANVPKEQ
jgi:hypothetical protein